MNIILLQVRLTLQEIDDLIREFPHFLFLSFNETTYKKLTPEHWARVEILFGNRLTAEELDFAHQLHWIHCPSPNLNLLCLPEIKQKESVIVTSTKDESIPRIGEFVISSILAFAKNMFHWKTADVNPLLIWDSKWRDSMWSLANRTLLQIGLGRSGTEIARRGQQFGMKVWGVEKHPSFNPFCQKTFSFGELHSLLPQVDVVSIALPRNQDFTNFFDNSALQLMKEDSILILLGSHKIINQEALIEHSKKMRGILIDAFYQTPVPNSSPLWHLPNVVITPDVSPRPKSKETQALSTFRFNLRQYIHSNFSDMKNIVPLETASRH